MKHSIKREQSQAGLSFAERKNVRPKVKHLRLLTLLALLMTAATGAWADVTWSLNNGTLTISGTGAMDNYVSVSDVPWYSSAELITSVNIGSGVTTIGNNAFADCISLATIDIPDGVTTIGNGAFYGCRALANVTIGSGVTTIGDYAFSACKSLVTIDIPDGVTTIGKYVFYGSRNLANVNIGSGMTSIGGYAFSECFALTAIDIPAGVTTIGNSTFYMCSELKDVIIPNGVTTIDDYAFVSCKKLESIIIPSSVTSIGDYAFKYSATLSDVFVLATTPATLGTQAFNMTASDFKIYVPAASVNEYKTKWSDYAGKILANPYYTVALTDGTKDKFSWQGKVGDGSYGNLPIKKLDGGETITLKYSGRRKVKSVTATTDAAPAAYTMAANATAGDVGKLICTDGHIHTYNADAACTKSRVAMIAYVGIETGVAGYTHGLALALTDEGNNNWNNAKTACTNKNTSATVKSASWMLPSRTQWETMGATNSTYTTLRNGFTSVGGSNLVSYYYYYWSSTEHEDDPIYAWYFDFNLGSWVADYKDLEHLLVRACLAF